MSEILKLILSLYSMKKNPKKVKISMFLFSYYMFIIANDNTQPCLSNQAVFLLT